MKPQEDLHLYVGTYTSHSSKGIYSLKLDRQTGAFSAPTLAAETENPSFLALHPNGQFLYCVNETNSGRVTAFARGRNGETLRYLNDQPTQGSYPCYVALDPRGKSVMVANYGTGSVILFPVTAGGALGTASDYKQHQGRGLNPRRQEGPHAHSIRSAPSGNFILAADLGIDKVQIYRLQNGQLHPVDGLTTAPGSGPRHVDCHPNGRYGYVVNELDSTVTVFSWNPITGQATRLETTSTLPTGFTGENTAADIHVHPSGKWLYASNRGHDSIAVFSLEEEGKRLVPTGLHSTLGQTPRNFAIDPSGNWLLAANQDSDSIVSFSIDGGSGQLHPSGHQIQVSRPVCLLFT